MEIPTNDDSKFNTQKMTEISDNIIQILSLCTKNKDLYNNDKNSMLKLIKLHNQYFYEKYPRICRILIFEDDITPLLGMIQTFAKVQEGKMSFNQANELIQGSINAKYVDPILNSEKLQKERDEKKKKEKQIIIN